MSTDFVEAELVEEPGPREPPVSWREGLAVILGVVLADIAVYRGHGYAGWAVMTAGAALLLVFGLPRGRTLRGQRQWRSAAVVAVMLAVLTARMLWCGWALQVGLSAVLLMALALALSGVVPYVLEVLVFPAHMMLGGLLGIAPYTRILRRPAGRRGRVAGLSIVLPLVTFLAFSLLFILANPDLLTSFGERIERVLRAVREWLIDYAPEPAEVVFWLVCAWIAIGMLRPLLSRPLLEEWERRPPQVKAGGAPSPSPLYSACRNTLLTVIVLFAIYLVFEYQTLWWRVFPPGFHYSGYAHQGAAWLTVALALATFILSLAFRGSILHDPHVGRLRRWAWIWSLENVLLAIAVYHRLYIYIGFNGMTRMRVVGIFGISAVLVGFLLVVWKIARNRGFLWLLRRHLWTVAVAVYFYGVLPVDPFVVQYNVRRILEGDSAPAVQISVHPISAEGVMYLPPLLQCDDEMVREGVRAYLAEERALSAGRAAKRAAQGWTAYQAADEQLGQRLNGMADELAAYDDHALRRATLQRFHDYAYQWY